MKSILVIIPLAAAAMAMPSVMHSHSSPQCEQGVYSCCTSDKNVKSNGLISLLVEGGVILGSALGGDNTCAPFNLIQNLNLLGFTMDSASGSTCKESIACCEGNKCSPITQQ